MTPQLFTVTPVTTRARKAWNELPPGLRDRITDALAFLPKADPAHPTVKKHLKGKILGRNRRCHYEYCGLPGGRRVFYTVDEDARRVEIEFIGPHP